MSFRRSKGFVGSVPQRFADKNIPICPICGTADPRWLINMQMKFFANRYLFKCSNCKAILSATVMDVARLDKLPILLLLSSFVHSSPRCHAANG